MLACANKGTHALTKPEHRSGVLYKNKPKDNWMRDPKTLNAFRAHSLLRAPTLAQSQHVMGRERGASKQATNMRVKRNFAGATKNTDASSFANSRSSTHERAKTLSLLSHNTKVFFHDTTRAVKRTNTQNACLVAL